MRQYKCICSCTSKCIKLSINNIWSIDKISKLNLEHKETPTCHGIWGQGSKSGYIIRIPIMAWLFKNCALVNGSVLIAFETSHKLFNGLQVQYPMSQLYKNTAEGLVQLNFSIEVWIVIWKSSPFCSKLPCPHDLLQENNLKIWVPSDTFPTCKKT